MRHWEPTPAERAALLERGGWATTAGLVLVWVVLCILVAMAVDVIT